MRGKYACPAGSRYCMCTQYIPFLTLDSPSRHVRSPSWAKITTSLLPPLPQRTFLSDVYQLPFINWSQIHKRTISLRFLGIILRDISPEVSVCNVYITNQFLTTFAQGKGGGGSRIRKRGDYVGLFFPITSENSAFKLEPTHPSTHFSDKGISSK